MESMDEIVLNNRMAERELSAFLTAVTDLFGPEQARESADDWLSELVACNDVPASSREWRTLTISAAARLASRVNARSYQGQQMLAHSENDVRK